MEARVFNSTDSDGNEVVLKFVRPNQTVLSKGDFVYREYFSKAIRAGVMTNAEANKILVERGIWNDDRESELIGLRESLNALESEIDGLGKEDGMSKYLQIKKLRRSIDELAQIRSSVTENTAESVASEMRNQFYASECVVYNANNKRVFKNLDDFLSRLDESISMDCYRQALISNYEQVLGIKVPENFTTEFAEDKWLHKISDELKTTDDSEPAQDDDEVKKPRRRGRKKKTPSVSA